MTVKTGKSVFSQIWEMQKKTTVPSNTRYRSRLKTSVPTGTSDVKALCADTDKVLNVLFHIRNRLFYNSLIYGARLVEKHGLRHELGLILYINGI
ncbi:MAG: hypothetical protein SPI18_09415 [Prevotella sp.]|nr:hypothetical protein [Prevotella sp.]